MFEFDPQAVSWFNQEVKASPIPVLVDFWAPGCEPCRVMKPVIDEIKVQFDGRLKIIRVNVEENFSVPMHYNVNGFPTLLLFKSGIVAEQISGTVSAKTLSKALNKYLAE
ncbi:thioredoxin fold domain-containing protein [Cyanobacteria bacterium FACHB-502]|nr:thioredoxin fold domain-containing protein [Cyanobacteria bacterium FACHB-502]